MIEDYERLENWRETAKTVRAEHRAIERRHPEEATALAREHIIDFYNLSAQDVADPTETDRTGHDRRGSTA